MLNVVMMATAQVVDLSTEHLHAQQHHEANQLAVMQKVTQAQ